MEQFLDKWVVSDFILGDAAYVTEDLYREHFSGTDPKIGNIPTARRERSSRKNNSNPMMEKLL
ncbi:MAG: hypothetical protein HFH36_08560 [Lachnospiraceae bacterium]|nr:hypothetical protein [Lachnospiraceae bacterium]